MVAGIDRTVTRRPVEKAPPTLELVLKRNSVERIKREKDPLGMLGELPALIAAGYEQVPEEDLVRLKWWGLSTTTSRRSGRSCSESSCPRAG